MSGKLVEACTGGKKEQRYTGVIAGIAAVAMKRSCQGWRPAAVQHIGD
jgi:hypothetical protein